MLHREENFRPYKKGFFKQYETGEQEKEESGISFLPAKVAPCLEGSCKAALRAGCREIIILAALAVFFHGKPCTIPARGGKARKKQNTVQVGFGICRTINR